MKLLRCGKPVFGMAQIYRHVSWDPDYVSAYHGVAMSGMPRQPWRRYASSLAAKRSSGGWT